MIPARGATNTSDEGLHDLKADHDELEPGDQQDRLLERSPPAHRPADPEDREDHDDEEKRAG
jgi:hypothetical protein